MPSHIFTRVGYWNDSIASNKESAHVAKEDGEQHDQAHAMDYLVYAYLQLAQDKEARAVVDELTKLEFTIERFPGPYAVAASQARYAFERGDWKAAAELQVPPPNTFTCMPLPTLRVQSVRRALVTQLRQRTISPSSSSCGIS
jgi:hypothetical protein